MFQKVLVVEDLDSIGFGIYQILKQETSIHEIIQSQHCDDANLKFLRAQKDNVPFDLLITDLSFKADYRDCKIVSGDALVHKLKSKQPSLKVIVYSVENRSVKVKSLFNNRKIDAYVVKGRRGLKNLIEAIKDVSKNKTYVSPEISNFMHRKDIIEIEDYDIQLLKLLSDGHTQEEISFEFKKKEIKPSGISSIEKRLNKLKLEFNAKNVLQLVSMVKDLGWL